MNRRIAVMGAGVSGLTVAWALRRAYPACEVTVFESSGRVGGIVETVRRDGFVIEMGPDSWVTEKPAARELATELGLGAELIFSEDARRKTLLLLEGKLEALPGAMRMMVPLGLEALAGIDRSPLLSVVAKAAFHAEPARAAELRRMAPTDDESIARFTERHFGREVLRTLAAPLLSGVFGGDVRDLSVRAVMAPFVAMEREHGSLIAALGEREAERRAIGRAALPIFTSLQSGLGTMTDRLAAALPAGSVRLWTRLRGVRRDGTGWRVGSVGAAGGRLQAREERFDGVVLAGSAESSAALLKGVDGPAARMLAVPASSAILVAFAWRGEEFALPEGFGLLVPAGVGQRASRLLAATFVDQKFAGRVPKGGRLVRVFFGTAEAERLLRGEFGDAAISGLALRELERILGPLPPPAIQEVRRWPRSLPQYAVGHLEQVARFERRLAAHPGLYLLGNALHGVGLPDLIRRARGLAEEIGAG